MFFIYIIYSASSDIYDVGYTNHVERRFEEHNHSAHSTFTSKYRPWLLKAIYQCGNEEARAIQIEKFIKKQKSRMLIEKLINEEAFTGILAQLLRVPQVPD